MPAVFTSPESTVILNGDKWKNTVPQLNCLWNIYSVVHTSIIHYNIGQRNGASVNKHL